ncbi:MAG: DMT family transporter [Planctomycetaceae bacterium]|jgi:drug/metabolite transporter (DMT)-like permease|nr:DMT family transporter [Planctomycetaceae bacterium]
MIPLLGTVAAVVIRIIVNPLSNVFQKRICADGQSPLFANRMTYGILAVVVLSFFLAKYFVTGLRDTGNFFEFPTEFWFYSLMVGLFGAVGNGCLVKAVQSGELSVLGPISAYKPVVGVIFGVILLREVPTLLGFWGIVIIIVGSYFVIDKTINGVDTVSGGMWTLMKRPDLCYRAAAMVLAAIEAVFIKKVILLTDPNTAFVVWCVSGFTFATLFYPVAKQAGETEHENAIARTHWHWYAMLVCTVGTMQWATNYAFAKMPVGYALALFQLSAVLSVLCGWFFFDEKNIMRKLFAATVMAVGSVLIILSSGK